MIVNVLGIFKHEENEEIQPNLKNEFCEKTKKKLL